jgi:hypothetical protein
MLADRFKLTRRSSLNAYVLANRKKSAMVSVVGGPGVGIERNRRNNPMQSKCNALEPTLPNPDKEWEPVPVTSNAERPLPTARGNVAGR